MKPAPFTYHAATTTQAALGLLNELRDQARVLAGGQSLVPLMNFRLAQPAHLVDINALDTLEYVRSDNGTLAVGARTRQSTLERSREAAELAPLLVEAIKLVGHPPIRHRGTVGGCLAHGDPVAELPAVALVTDGEMVLTSSGGQRTLPAADFFLGPFTTAVAADELLTEFRVPVWPAKTGHAFLEFSRTHGNFAVVGTAVLLHLDGTRIDRAAIALCGVGGTPLRARRAEERLLNSVPQADVLDSAVEASVADLNPASDVHGTAAFRRKVAKVYVRRALELALARAKGERP
jgi:carbon-monoxide dehydrogenase medium subunit